MKPVVLFHPSCLTMSPIQLSPPHSDLISSPDHSPLHAHARKHSCMLTQLLALSLSALPPLPSPTNLFSLSPLCLFIFCLPSDSSSHPQPHIFRPPSFFPHTSASPLRLPYLTLFSLPLAVSFLIFALCIPPL